MCNITEDNSTEAVIARLDGCTEPRLNQVMTSLVRHLHDFVQTFFESAEDLARRAGIELVSMKIRAGADALMSLSGHRRQQVWDGAALRSVPELPRDATVGEVVLELTRALEGEGIVFDEASRGLTLLRHPLALLRDRLKRFRISSSANWTRCPPTAGWFGMPAS